MWCKWQYSISSSQVFMTVLILLCVDFFCRILLYKYKRKHNLRTSMNKRTHFFIKIYLSHFILDWVDVSVGVWEMGGETYTQREDFFFPYLLPGARSSNACTPLQARRRTLCSAAHPLLKCDSLPSLQIWPHSSHHVVSFWLHTCSTWVPWSGCPVY